MQKILIALFVLAIAGAGALSQPAEAAFPGVNGKIAFTSDRDGNEEIYVMNADGSAKTNLSNNAARDDGPAWSARGDKIAFVSLRDGVTQIYVMNADGSGQTNVSNLTGSDHGPSWSPSGSQIAFAHLDPGQEEVYVVNADGTGHTNLTNDPAQDLNPAWSPDGSKVAFNSDRDGNIEIYVMDADGSAPTRLTNDPGIDQSPAWSPDGSQIAFERTDGVYVMNAAGSGKALRKDGFDPAWSPDGSLIAVTRTPGGNFDIYTMDSSDGSGQTRLTTNAAIDRFPDWQPLSVGGIAELPLVAGIGSGAPIGMATFVLLSAGVVLAFGAALWYHQRRPG